MTLRTTTSATISAGLRIKAALNGGRSAAEHPAIPVTPGELARAAVAAADAGAQAVHIHVRAPDGRESLATPEVRAAVAAIRRTRPGLPIGVSTGLWITDGDPVRRLASIRDWASSPPRDRPDFASVNVGEPGFASLAGQLLELGVGVEAGVWSTADADALAASGLGSRCLRVLVEVIDVPPPDAAAAAARILDRLDAHGEAAPRLLHGEEAAAWPMVVEAGRRGLATRIGFEDVLHDPDGRPVPDNADLVRLAITLWTRSATSIAGGHPDA